MYKVIITPDAQDEMTRLNDSGEDSEIKRLKELLLELSQHPETGIGKPEELGNGRWSRRVNEKNRLVYQIDPELQVVTVTRVLGHYTDH